MTRSLLIDQLSQYTTIYPEEFVFVDSFLELLQHPDAYQRTHLPGHITGSSWIVDPTNRAALFVHHGKLNTWLQPGGHSDGDEDTLAVALREAQEETGVVNPEIPIATIFDIDIHPIPARKDMPEHLHYDVRFLFYASSNKKVVVSEESHDVKWIRFEDIPQYSDNESIFRMLEKTKRLI